MDYEKKYNEALERAREIKSKICYSHLSTESCKAVSEYIDTIIPELAESEDEKIIDGFKGLLRGIRRGGGLTLNMVPIEKCEAWLEKQKEQKPAEWSEEVTKDLVHILKVLDDCYIYGKHDLSKTDYDNLTSTLKSLRPSWKPSEEQMRCLEMVLSSESMDDNVHSVISDLYEKLKKL